jgi:hypothetical protein
MERELFLDAEYLDLDDVVFLLMGLCNIHMHSYVRARDHERCELPSGKNRENKLV